MNRAATESHAEAIRQALSKRSAMGHTELLSALPFDAGIIDQSLRDMIGRGEVETLRPCFPKTRAPTFYRLVRDADDWFPATQKRRMISWNKLFDFFEMEMA